MKRLFNAVLFILNSNWKSFLWQHSVPDRS